MRTCFVHAAIVIGVASTSVAAQTSLTESQALAQLSSASPRVQAIRAAVEIARSDVQAASRWPNPRATFNRESAVGITENIVTVAQVLPVTGRRDLEVQAATAGLGATTSRVDDQLRRVRSDLRLAFARLLYTQAWERELSSAVDRVRSLADLLQRREAAGDAAGFDRIRAEIEALDLDAERAAATAERLRAQGALASFLSGPAQTDIVALSSDRPRSELPSVEALLARAESTRGELLALRQDVERAELTERAAARRVIPEPEVVIGTKSSDAGTGDTGSVFAVHASLPLFDRASPEQAAARTRAAEAQARIAQFQWSMRAEIAALRAAAIEKRESSRRYVSGQSSTEQLERIAQVSYDAGERGIFELLDAYRTAARVRVRQAELEMATRQVEIELEFASGWEIE